MNYKQKLENNDTDTEQAWMVADYNAAYNLVKIKVIDNHQVIPLITLFHSYIFELDMQRSPILNFRSTKLMAKIQNDHEFGQNLSFSNRKRLFLMLASV